MEATTWAVVQSLGLVVSRPEPDKILVYGSSDPYPNPAEFLLTQLVAKRHQLGWQFFVYKHGRNLPFSVDDRWVNPLGVFNLEFILPKDLTLGEIARKVFRLRQEPVVIAHIPWGATLRATSNPERKWSGGWANATIPQLHETGGWLGGSAIHFILRLWAENRPDVLYVCPFQEKGRVYEIYRGFKRPLFVLASFIRFIPPARMGLPDWAPAPWSYWLSLPAAFRRRVRKEVKKRIWSGERRIEIQLP
jgi:hypothetical protein